MPGDVKHQILNNGPPVSARARRMTAERKMNVKVYFQSMIAQGKCKYSSSACASPIYIVDRKDGGIRVCGDYRGLNNVTKPVSYLVPHLHDFS